jgi:hypothetical protein
VFDQKWVWGYTSREEDDVKKCKEGDILNDCLLSFNRTDFWIPQTGATTTGDAFASHKYSGKSAL